MASVQRLPSRRTMVVVDANAYWTENLFAACNGAFDVLLLKPREARAHASRFGGRLRPVGPKQLAPSVWEYAFALPPRYTTMLWPIARHVIARAGRSLSDSNPDVLVICFPEYLGLADLLRPRQLVYYNYDDYSAHWPKRAAWIERREAQTVARADSTICIAKRRRDALAARFPDRADSIHHIPIGVTPAYMVDAGVVQDKPLALSSISRPMAGYVGTLGYRFDFAFLAEVAAARPGISFVLGGRPPQQGEGDAAWWAGVVRARTLPNVHFIGWIDHATLGSHLAAFDVLLMVYSKCAFNESACPAKLWDYLGVGVPIVANDRNPETLLWRHVVAVGANPEAFARLLDSALKEGRARAPERLAIARDHTWDNLAKRLVLKVSGEAVALGFD